MGSIHQLFPGKHHHARTSSRRAAKLVRRSAETSADRARSVEIIDDHHSGGIQSRCHHFVTMPADAPISSAIASLAPCASFGPHNSMTDLNEVICDMPSPIGHLVLESKANWSLDMDMPLGQNVPMAKSSRKPLSDYDLGFMARTWAARESKGWSQAVMGTKLGGLTQDTYKQYETRGMLPRPLIGPFVALTGISFEYLLDGRAEGPAWRERFTELASKQRSAKRPKRAA